MTGPTANKEAPQELRARPDHLTPVDKTSADHVVCVVSGGAGGSRRRVPRLSRRTCYTSSAAGGLAPTTPHFVAAEGKTRGRCRRGGTRPGAAAGRIGRAGWPVGSLKRRSDSPRAVRAEPFVVQAQGRQRRVGCERPQKACTFDPRKMNPRANSVHQLGAVRPCELAKRAGASSPCPAPTSRSSRGARKLFLPCSSFSPPCQPVAAAAVPTAATAARPGCSAALLRRLVLLQPGRLLPALRPPGDCRTRQAALPAGPAGPAAPGRRRARPVARLPAWPAAARCARVAARSPSRRRGLSGGTAKHGLRCLQLVLRSSGAATAARRQGSSPGVPRACRLVPERVPVVRV